MARDLDSRGNNVAPLDPEFLSRFDARLRRQLLPPVRFSLMVGAVLFLLFGVWEGMTVSVGVAQARPGENLETLLHRADAALYASKRGGRNRVSLAAPEPARWPRPEANQVC